MTPWPSPARAWYAVAVLMLAYLFAYVDRQVLSLLAVPIQADLGVTDTQLGLLQGLAFAAFYTLLGVPLGWLADRRSRVKLLVAGIVLWSLATAACGLADTFGELFLARVLVGVGEATLAPAALSLIADHFPPATRGLATSVYVASGSIGAGVALLAGGLVLAHATSVPGLGDLEPWQATFVLAGLPGLLVAVLLATVREPTRRELAASGGDIVFGRFLRERQQLLWLHLGGMAVFSAMSFAVLAWVPVYLVRHFGMDLATAGVAFGAAFAIGGPLGAVAGGAVARRWREAGRSDALLRTSVLGTAAASAVYAAAPWLPDTTAAVLAFGFGTFCSAFPAGPSVAALNAVAPNEVRGRLTAVYYFAINLVGLGLGPLITGVMTDYVFADRAAVGWSMSVTAAVLGPVAALLLAGALRPFRTWAVAPA